jgi:HSP20 family molecular chaperone IbpA
MNVETNAVTKTSPETRVASAKPRETRQVSWLRPPVDVWENDDALTLVLDVPGVAPDAFEIRAEGNSLTVQGVRREGGRGWHRVFTIPPTIDTEKIEARAENGVLTLVLPRAEAAKPRRIEVR